MADGRYPKEPPNQLGHPLDTAGKVTLRNNGQLHKIRIGRQLARTPIVLLIADLDVRIIDAITGAGGARLGIGLVHSTGMYIIWIVFVNAYIGSALDDIVFLIPVVAALLVGVLRLAAWHQRKARRAARAVVS